VLPSVRGDGCEEDLGQEGNRSLGKMLQGPVGHTVRNRILADLETPEAS